MLRPCCDLLQWRCVLIVMSCLCTSLCMAQRTRGPLPPLSVDGEPSGRAGLLNRGISPFWRCSNSTSFVLLGDQLCLDLSLLLSAPPTWTALSVPHNCFVMVGCLALTFPIWLVFRGRALLAGISNHRYRGWREARLTCWASRTPIPLTACVL